jgi:ADP-sugar diphosphatase
VHKKQQRTPKKRVGFVKIKTHTTLVHHMQQNVTTTPASTDGDGGGTGLNDNAKNSELQQLEGDNSKPLPGICFLRGNAVSILVALFCSTEDGAKEDEVYSLLTEQPRVPLGMPACLEIPAGMMDDADDSGAEDAGAGGGVCGIAVQEMEEECGIAIRPGDFVDLTALACTEAVRAGNLSSAVLSPSGGACDERLRYLYVEKHVTRMELDSMQGRLQGLRDHGEYITLRVVKFDDVWKISGDSKAMMYVPCVLCG